MKTKLIVLSLGLALFASCVINTGTSGRAFDRGRIHNGQAIQSERAISSVNAINVSSHLLVRLHQSVEPRLIVSAPTAERSNNLVTEIRNGELHIYERDIRRINMSREGIFYVDVYLPEISKVQLSGAAIVRPQTELRGTEFSLQAMGSSDFISQYSLVYTQAKIALSGSSDYQVKELVARDVHISASGSSDSRVDRVAAETLEFEATGSSDLRATAEVQGRITIHAAGASDVFLSGMAAEISADVLGTSDLRGRSFSAKKAHITASGSSDVILGVTEELSYSISGASDLYYYGRPRILRASSSGASDVHQR